MKDIIIIIIIIIIMVSICNAYTGGGGRIIAWALHETEICSKDSSLINGSNSVAVQINWKGLHIDVRVLNPCFSVHSDM